jgi:hypothetical protein
MRPSRHAPIVTSAFAAIAIVVGGCLGTGGPTPTPVASDSAAPPTSAPSVSAPAETTAPATPDPGSETAAPPSESAAPSEPPASESAAPGGSAAACSGTDNNRDFYAAAAEALSFAVYCPVLPRGWFVQQGEYQLRGGGQLHITYRGPGGAGLELVERGPCPEGDDCMPAGTEEGNVSFGDLPATLVALDDGRLAVVAEAAGSGSWWIIGDGLDEAALTEIASDLVRVGG